VLIMSGSTAQEYQFKPHERPTLPGGPFNPEHPSHRRMGYLAISCFIGVTGGLGNALITTNLGFVQGSLDLSAVEAAWLPVVFVMTNVCANLVLIKWRQEYGLQGFVRWMLSAYALATIAHLFIHSFASAVAVRAASGIAVAGLTTLAVLYATQALQGPKALTGIMLGISFPQLAIPVARVISPSLLDWGDWRMAYFFEAGLALATLAVAFALPLPPSERSKTFEKKDILTIALLFPGVAMLCAALGLGRVVWWTEAPWIGWALVSFVVLVSTALVLEHSRANPLLRTRWLGKREILRIAGIAIFVRILVSEQTYGAVGLMSVLGMGIDQFRTLYAIVLLASIAGIGAALMFFKPTDVGRPIRIACIAIAIGAFMDAGATSLTRPQNIYLSQALIGFGALLFIGPAMAIGISRVLLAGTQNFLTWIVLFSATQNLGGLIGTAVFGTFQTAREKYHSHDLVEQIILTHPLAAQRLAGGAGTLSGVIGDPALRNAQGAALLNVLISREANVLAFNDVFLLIGVLALLVLLWGFLIQFRYWRLGLKSPVVELAERLAAAAAARSAKPGA
jgi:MFS family permease